jgi:hypothetical protein
VVSSAWKEICSVGKLHKLIVNREVKRERKEREEEKI